MGRFGWSGFFAVCAAMVLPGLALVSLATRAVDAGVRRAADSEL